MAELKPCPFCGGEAKLAIKSMGHGAAGAYAYCTDCSSTSYAFCVRADWCANDEAIKAWNRRAESEELAFTRQFIHEHGLDFALASAWKGRAEDDN